MITFIILDHILINKSWLLVINKKLFVKHLLLLLQDKGINKVIT